MSCFKSETLKRLERLSRVYPDLRVPLEQGLTEVKRVLANTHLSLMFGHCLFADDLIEWLSAWPDFKHIERLDLTASSASIETLRLIRRCSSLIDLGMSSSQILLRGDRQRDLGEGKEILSSLQSLRCLTLDQNQVAVLEQLSPHPELEDLFVHLDEPPPEYLFSYLESLPRLEVLDLYCSVRAPEIARLAEILKDRDICLGGELFLSRDVTPEDLAPLSEVWTSGIPKLNISEEVAADVQAYFSDWAERNLPRFNVNRYED